jgi:hypothetical protein
MSLYDDVILPDVGINLNPQPSTTGNTQSSSTNANNQNASAGNKTESDIGIRRKHLTDFKRIFTVFEF